jgi:ankyrin repeat protein
VAGKRKRKLIEAVYEGNGRRVARLLDRGVSPNTRTEDGSTVLYLAAVHGDAWSVGALLVAGANPNKVSAADSEGTPLCAAASWGHGDVVDALLEARADPNLPERDGFTPLLWAAAGGWERCATSILDAGGDPTRPDDHGRTPLHRAAERGSLGLVRLLLERGARPDAVDDAGRTPWDVAHAWLGKDVAAVLRRDLLDGAPAGSTVTTRITVQVDVKYPAGGGRGREVERGHREIAALLAPSS